jgi:alpha-mannosidase
MVAFLAGSLFPHNVVLVPLGDDFFYTNEKEWDQQYANYKMLIDFINEHRDEYHVDIR